MIENKKILITGASGTVARPCAEALAEKNEVWCLGRFGDVECKNALEALGIHIHYWDLGVDSLEGVPTDFTHVMHSGLAYQPDNLFSLIERNGFATAQLMMHCREAEAFLHVSTAGVYRLPDNPQHRQKESDPMGGISPYMPNYTTQKAGCEAIAIALSRILNLKTIIARANVTFGPYGFGGLPSSYYQALRAGKPIPMPADRENYCMPMYTDDAARQVPLLWEAATVPATIVNWGGNDMVTRREIVEYVAEITGIPAKFESNSDNLTCIGFDNTRRDQLIGRCEVDWRDGVRRTLEARFPGSVVH